mgnify:CR=1 FL=1
MFKIHDDKVYFVAETPDINKVIEIFLPKDDRGTIMDSHEIRVDLCRAVIHMEKKGVRVLKVRNPEVRKTRYAKDFSWGFYCTSNYEQAARWSKKGRSRGIVNVFEYTESPMLNIKKFPEMSDEWLDFIAICRSGKHHDYDIVEGPMADDTIWNYVNDFLSGDISREAFWALAKFKHPTHQISFHTEVALKCLSFKEAIEV